MVRKYNIEVLNTRTMKNINAGILIIYFLWPDYISEHEDIFPLYCQIIK